MWSPADRIGIAADEIIGEVWDSAPADRGGAVRVAAQASLPAVGFDSLSTSGPAVGVGLPYGAGARVVLALHGWSPSSDVLGVKTRRVNANPLSLKHTHTVGIHTRHSPEPSRPCNIEIRPGV